MSYSTWVKNFSALFPPEGTSPRWKSSSSFRFSPFFSLDTCHFRHLGLRDTHHLIASLDLLCHQRFRGGHKNDLARREPAVEIVHDDGGNEGLPQPCGQTHQCVAEQSGPGDVQLVVPHRAVGRVNPQGARRGTEAAILQTLLPLSIVHRDQQHVIVRLWLSLGRCRQTWLGAARALRPLGS